MNGVQGAAEGLVENVAHPGTAAQFRGLDIPGRALDCAAVGAGELRDDLQQGLALVGDILAIGVQQRLELRGHDVDASLQEYGKSFS